MFPIENVETEKKWAVLSYVCEYIKDVDAITDMVNSIYFQDYVEIGDFFSIETPNYEKLKLCFNGTLDPRNNGTDYLEMSYYFNDVKIESGTIEVYYGYGYQNSDGNIGDAASESLTFNFYNLYEKLEEKLGLISERVHTINERMKLFLEALEVEIG